MNELVNGVLRDAIGVFLSFIFIVGVGGLIDHFFWKRKRKQALFEEVYREKLSTSEEAVELALETSVCLSNLFQKWGAALSEAKIKKVSKKISDDATVRLRNANDELKDLVYKQVKVLGRANLYFSSTTTGQLVSIFKVAKDIQDNPYRIAEGYSAEELLSRTTLLYKNLRDELGLDKLSGADHLREILYSRSKLADEKYSAALAVLLTKNIVEVAKAMTLYIEKSQIEEVTLTQTMKETFSLLLDMEKQFGAELTVTAAVQFRKEIVAAVLKSEAEKVEHS